MNISEAVEIIEQQAKRDGVGFLELLETIDRYGASSPHSTFSWMLVVRCLQRWKRNDNSLL